MLRLLSPLLFALLLAGAPLAQTVTWTADGDGTTWSDGANWSTGSAPEAGSDVVIDLGGGSYEIAVDTSPTVASLALASGSAALMVDTPLEITNSFAFSDGFVGGTSRLRAASLSWTGGDMRDGGLTEITGAATIAGGPGGPFAAPGLVLRQRRLTLEGTTDLTGAIDLRGGTVEIPAGGEIRLNEDSGIYSDGFGGGGTIQNAGRIVRAGTNSGLDGSRLGVGPFGRGEPTVLLNTGEIATEIGELNVYPAAGSTLGGTFRADDTSALTLQDPAQDASGARPIPATFTGSGRITVIYGYELTGTLSVSGTLTLSRNASIGASAVASGLGTLAVSGNGNTTRVELPGTLVLGGFAHSYSDLALTPVLEASGDVSLGQGGTLLASPPGVRSGGEFQFSGDYTAEPGGDLVARGTFEAVEGFEGPGAVTLNGRDLQIEGIGRVTNSQITLAGSSEITVGPAGVLTLRPDGAIREGAGGGSLLVQGELGKEAGLGGVFGDPNVSTAFDIDVPVEVASGGTLRVGSGRLNIAVGLTNNGRVTGRDTLAFGTANGFSNPGVVAPGDGFDFGRLTILGDYVNGERLALDVGGDTPEANQDQLTVSGTAFLVGTLEVSFAAGFTLSPGETLVLIEAGSVAGAFENETLPAGTEVVYEAARVLLRGTSGGGGGPGLADTPWPMLGGGVAHRNQAPVEGPTSLALEWTYTRNTSYTLAAQPVLAPDGTIYTSNVGDAFFAINPDGTEKWRAEIEGGRSSAAVAEDSTVYFGSGDGTLYALNPDGSQKWVFDAGDRINGSPAVADDGTIYIASNAQQLFAVNADGTQRWARNIGGFATSAPAIANDGTVVVSSSSGTVVAFSANGDLRWGAGHDGIGGSPTITPDGRVILQVGGAVRALGLETGSQIWARDGLSQGETPGYFDGPTPLVFASEGQTLHALSAASGDTVWTLDVGDGAYPTTVTLDALGKAYVMGLNNNAEPLTIYVLDAASGSVLSTTHLSEEAERAPILDAQGRLIVPVRSGLKAFTSAGGPVLAVSPEALSFGEVASGATETRTLTLTNTGGSPLTVFGVYEGGGQPAFSAAFDDAVLIAPGASVEVSVSFSPPEAGEFSSQVFIESDSENGSFVTVDVSGTGIESANPPLARDDTATTPEDQAVTVQVLSNDTSNVSEPVEITATTDPANGSIALVDSGERIRYTPDADFFGTDTFTYTITDSGGSDTATVTVTVTPVNDAPIAQDDAATTPEDTAVTIEALANDSDIDSETLTITDVAQPDNGTSEIIGEGSLIRYTPEADFFGTDTFTYTVSDGDGETATATVTVTVTPINDAPLAADDAAATPEDTAVEIAVLANDSDPDGDALTVSDVGQPANGTATTDGTTVVYTPEADFVGTDSFAYTITDGVLTASATVTVTVIGTNDAPIAQDDAATTAEDTAVEIAVLANDSDPDEDALTVASVTDPANGTTTTDGANVVYTPDADFNGTDSFAYTVSDGNGGSDTATVTVTVTPVNDAPLAVDDDATTDEETAVEIAVLANDSDPEGDALTVAAVSTPENGTATTDGTTVTYTPEAGFSGTDTFTYTVNDGNDGEDTATVTVAVSQADQPPLARDDTATTPEDQAVTVQVLSNDTSNVSEPVEITATTDPANGSIALVDSGERIRYTPDADFFGTDTFTYTITDSGGSDTATVTVTVTPVNDAPIAQDDAATTDEDTAVTIEALANDSDIDSETLTITDVAQPDNGTSEIVGEGSLVRYTPEADFFGTDTFTYTVSDGDGETATATVTVTVTPVNDAPLAADDAAATPEDTAVEIAVLANDSDPDGDALTVSDVGQPANGTATTDGTTVVYTPEADFNGTDSFGYTVADGNGGTDTATVTVTVTPINDAPLAQNDAATTPEDTAVEIPVLVNDSDPDGDALSVASVTDPANGTLATDGTTIVYTPDADFNGTDAFTYTVSDGNGGTATATVTVTVTPINDAPLAVDDAATTNPNEAVEIAVLANDSDPDGDALTVATATGAANGTLTTNGTTVTYTPEAGFRGTDTFTYTVTDGTLTATASVTVTVGGNAPPLAEADTATTAEDTAVEIPVLVNDSDPDGDALTVASVTQPANGTATTNGTTVVYTPETDFNGTDSFAYTVADGNGGTDTATVTVTVTPVNDAPLAEPDAAETPEDTPVLIEVLANDSDIDSETLTVSAVTQPASGAAVIVNNGTLVRYTPEADFNGTDSFTYTVSDGSGGTDTETVTVTVTPVNDAPLAVDDAAATPEDTAVTVAVLANDSDVDSGTLSVESVTQPASGAATITADGRVRYTPEADFNGTDTFTYTVSDGDGGTATATVTVTVTPVNDAPIAQDDAITTTEDTPATIPVLANDTDVDGDDLTVTDVSPPANGTAATDGTTVTYTPAPNFVGTDSFTYTVTDGELSDTATVTVQVGSTNDAPIAQDDTATTPEDTAVEIAVLANDSDPDGDALTVSDVGQPTNGTASTKGTTVVYTPEADFNGTDSFAYTVADGNGGTDTATVTVTVTPVNDAPLAQNDAATTPEDTAVEIPVLVNDSDPDGDDLAVTGLTQPANGTAATDGTTVTYTPAPDSNGTDSFTYTASDGNGGTSSATVTVTVTPVNDAPLAQADSASASPGTAVEIAVLANDSDPDGDALTVTEASGATNGTVTTDGQTVTYTPEAGFRGTDTFTYTISDGALNASASVTVTVGGTNAPPLATADAATTPEDQAVTVAVLANDSDPDGDALSVASVTDPANGTAMTDGATVVYTPDADFNGTDAFTYTVSDGNGGSDTATVTVTVTPVNDAPLAVADTATTNLNVAVEIAVLANDSDVDGDALSVAGVSDPVNGTATTDGTTVTFTPEAGFAGTATVNYTVTDGELTDTAEITVTVSDSNQPPVARDDAAPVRPGDSVLIDVLANDEDPEGDAVTIVSVQSPTASGGTAVRESGQIRYTAPAGFSGTDTFTYTISDPQGATATATVTVTAQAYLFALTDLGTLGGARSAAMAVAADGRVVGTAEDASGALRPTLWTGGTSQALTLTGAPSGFAAAIDGQTIVGVQYGPDGEATAFRVGAGAMTLPGLGGSLTSAYGVREGGVTVGSSTSSSGGIEALAWDAAGVATPLGTFGLARSEAFGVSPLGLVIGTAQSDVDARAFAGTDLLSGADGRAYAANASGVIVGSIGNGAGDVSAVRWTGTGAPEALGGLGGGFAEAYAVNGAGWVVGASGVAAATAAKNSAMPTRGPLPLGGRLAPDGSGSLVPAGVSPEAGSSAKRAGVAGGVVAASSAAAAYGAVETRAVLWVDGQTLDLGTIIDVPGWTLLEARGINDAGQIAGTGLFNGQPRAFLLTPTDNTAPLAADDRAETTMGEPVEILLVANDSDDDGDALTVASLLAPENGSVQPAGPLAVRYTPTPGFTGEDTFGYTLADGRGGLAQAKVRVTVRAEMPEGFTLRTPAPNPASGGVAFVFTLDAPADDVRMDVIDLLGRSLAVASEGARDAGEHTVRFDVRGLAPGTYVCRLLAGGQALMRTFTVVR